MRDRVTKHWTLQVNLHNLRCQVAEWRSPYL